MPQSAGCGETEILRVGIGPGEGLARTVAPAYLGTGRLSRLPPGGAAVPLTDTCLSPEAITALAVGSMSAVPPIASISRNYAEGPNWGHEQTLSAIVKRHQVLGQHDPT
jgi:hypothetical protein